jgi:ribosomal protein S6
MAQVHCAPTAIEEVDRMLNLEDKILRSFCFKEKAVKKKKKAQESTE